VARQPPAGAQAAALYGLDPTGLDIVGRVIEGLGLDTLEIIDGWRADLDGDGIPEGIIRGFLGKDTAVIVIDPIDGANPSARPRADNARVFVSSRPPSRGGKRVAETPFSFNVAGYTYLAWSGKDGSDTVVTTVRASGLSYAIDTFPL
jgi:hypothetical protein